MSTAARIAFPLRFKVLITVLVIVTAVVSVITFTMAALFHQDKRTYITDLVSMVSLSSAEESRMLLLGYRERLITYSRVLGRKDLPERERQELMNGFFGDFPELLAVSRAEGGRVKASAFAAGLDRKARLAAEDLARRGATAPAGGKGIAGRTTVRGVTVGGLPCLQMTVALPGSGPPHSMQAIVRIDALRRLVSRSKVMAISFWDEQGSVLVANDVTGAAAAAAGEERRRQVTALREKNISNLTVEYGEKARR